DYTGVSNGKGR
ncbi:unnamed protein product, partial [Allacma fusca]